MTPGERVIRIMSSHSLVGEPAFKGVKIVFRDIPCTPEGCPLGLYSRWSRTITLPPNFTEGALLHELGHAHGDYYRGDLSESYAEAFRQKFTGGRVLLAYIPFSRIEEIANYERLFQEGEKGEVEIILSEQLSEQTIDTIRNAISKYHNIQFIPGRDHLRFRFRKEIPVLPIIATIARLAIPVAVAGAIYKIGGAVARHIVPIAAMATGIFITAIVAPLIIPAVEAIRRR